MPLALPAVGLRRRQMDMTQRETTVAELIALLAALDNENARLQRTNARLEERVAALRTKRRAASSLATVARAGAEMTETPRGKTSRWNLLRTLFAAAAATVGGGALLAMPAAGARADGSEAAVTFASRRAGTSALRAFGSNAEGVEAFSSGGIAVSAVSMGNHGVRAESYYGGTAIYAVSHVHDGASGPGVHAISDGHGAGVYAASAYGNGMTATSAGDPGTAAVHARGSNGADGIAASSARGYGGTFAGGAAPLRLMPTSTAGAPRTGTHRKGEVMVDAMGMLHICTADGTPGMWARVVTQADSL
jgi:hypothetical protein